MQVMNNTNFTVIEDPNFENNTGYENDRRIRKIEDGKYVVLIYFVCLVMIFAHFLLFFHILFGFKTSKDNLRRMIVNNKVSPQDCEFSKVLTLEPDGG